MDPLRVVVFDGEREADQGLVCQLQACGEPDGVTVLAVAGQAGALAECRRMPVDLVLCGWSGCGGVDLLRDLAALCQPPAVAFHGAVLDLVQLEDEGMRLGLAYLGHLRHPVSAERLERMLALVRFNRDGRLLP